MKEILGVLLPWVIFFCIFFLILRWANKRNKKIEEKMNKGISAKAKILDISDATTGHTPHGSTIIRMELDIHPSAGENYKASTCWCIKLFAIPKVQQGKWIEIKIDADDHQKIYPVGNWAIYWEFT